MVHLLTPELVAVLAPTGLVCVETTVFFLDLKREIHSEYLTKVSFDKRFSGPGARTHTSWRKRSLLP
jgi:hypothetical protein